LEDHYKNLETIVEEEEFIEPNFEQEALIQDTYGIEIEEQYFRDPKLFEVHDAIEKCRELSPEEMEKPYLLDDQQLEIMEEVKEINEMPDEHEIDGVFIFID
jgi:hypothetical protein